MPLEAYSVPLQRVAVAKMVRQLSEVYSVMRVSHMSELAPFIGFGQVGRGGGRGGVGWWSCWCAGGRSIPASLHLGCCESYNSLRHRLHFVPRLTLRSCTLPSLVCRLSR